MNIMYCPQHTYVNNRIHKVDTLVGMVGKREIVFYYNTTITNH